MIVRMEFNSKDPNGPYGQNKRIRIQKIKREEHRKQFYLDWRKETRSRALFFL
jgi:hypothetical protein